MAAFDTFTSVFADTGENMNLKPNALREKEETRRMVPRVAADCCGHCGF